MKLRNGKIYKTFNWSNVIYNIQLKASNALLTPFNILYSPELPKIYLLLKKNNIHKKIIKDGIKLGFLKIQNNIITNRIELKNNLKNILFLTSLSTELKKNNINGIIINQ